MTKDQRLIVEGVANPDSCCLEMEVIEAVRSALDDIDRLRDACEVTLLFHSGGHWDDAKALRWFNITQDPDCTSKKLCNHIRKVLADFNPSQQGV